MVIMRYPYCEQSSHMVFRQGDDKVETFSPQRANEPFAEGIGLRSPHRRLEHPQPQVADALVKLLREDAIAVMDQEAVGMVSGNRFAQLLQGPRRCWMRRDIGMQDAARSMFHDDEHVEEAKGGCDHYAEVTGHDRLGMIAHKRAPALGSHAFAPTVVHARRHVLPYSAR